METALAAAHDELIRRYREADQADDWKERTVLEQLTSVADYIRRIGLPTATSHYRAEKAGALLEAAGRLQRETLWAFAGFPDGNDQEREIERAHDLLEKVTSTLVGAMWGAARQSGWTDDQVRSARQSARELQVWADSLAVTRADDE